MAHDIISDALNMVMNSKKAGKNQIEIARSSKFLVKILDLAKKHGYLDYQLNEKVVKIIIEKINVCKAIKPRYNITYKEIEKYARRYLPARDFGFMLISTSKGLMTHKEAEEKNLGGSLIAYFF